MKKRGFGAGKWNGFGGKVEAGEGIEEAARREMHEESGILVGSLTKVACLIFVFENDEKVLRVHAFETRECVEGSPVETDEMRPKWYSEDELPLDGMWVDDREWLPRVLQGERLNCRFVFRGHEVVLAREITQTSSPDIELPL